MKLPAPVHACMLLCAWLCLIAGALFAAEPAAEWQKFKGKSEDLAPNPTFSTPGQFLNYPARKVAFPAGGLAIDLPIDATLPGGKSVKAAIQPNRYLWIDVNNDGQVDVGEKFPPTRTGYGPVTVTLQYKNGTQSPYTLHLMQTATPGTFELKTGQMIRFSFTWQRRKIIVLLIDQNNNGRYDDQGQDAILIDQRPGALLAKTVTIGADAGSVAEIVVYPDGTTLEIREYAGPTGVLDPVSGYTPPQEGVTLAYLAMDNALARPGFSAAFPRARVPLGSYDFVCAQLQRGNETVRVEKGGLPATAVTENAVSGPKWGGEVEFKYAMRREGEFLIFDGFKYTGKEHQEIYLPQPPFNIHNAYRAEEIFRAAGGMPIAPGSNASLILAAGNLEEDNAGGYLPLKVKHKGKKMLMQINFSYLSGVMGSIAIHDKLEFTPAELENKP